MSSWVCFVTSGTRAEVQGQSIAAGRGREIAKVTAGSGQLFVVSEGQQQARQGAVYHPPEFRRASGRRVLDDTLIPCLTCLSGLDNWMRRLLRGY